MRNMWIERGMVARRYILIRVRAKSNIMETRSVQTEEPEGENNWKHTGENCFSLFLIRGIVGLFSTWKNNGGMEGEGERICGVCSSWSLLIHN